MSVTNSQLINLLHVLIIGPLLLYIGLMGERCPKLIFYFIGILGLFVFVYHLYLYEKKAVDNFRNIL